MAMLKFFSRLRCGGDSAESGGASGEPRGGSASGSACNGASDSVCNGVSGEASRSGVVLRAVEPEDLELLYRWENDTTLWAVSDTLAPLSRYNLREYILNSHIDIHASRQLKLIAMLDGKAVGMTDLFDYDPHNERVSVGILVFEEKMRGRGLGEAILREVVSYAFNTLSLHQITALVGERNVASIALFEKLGFERCGFKRDWFRRGNEWENVIEFQLLA